MAFEGLSSKLQTVFKKLSGRGKLSEKDVKEAMREVKLALLEADVSFTVVKKFIAQVSQRAVGAEVLESLTPGQQVIKIVNEELTNLMGGANAKVEFGSKTPAVILLCGLQGAGKTTMAGKLGAYLQKQFGKTPLLVACDIYRPAAIQQLQVVGEKLKLPVFEKGQQDPIQTAKEAVEYAKSHMMDLVIVDTAGRLHIDEAMMEEIAGIRDALQPAEILLVVDAMTGQDAVNVAKAFNETLELTGVIVTKLDGDTRGGAALSVTAVTGKPIKFAGIGEKLDQIEAFHPDRMAGRILGMGDMLYMPAGQRPIRVHGSFVKDQEVEKIVEFLKAQKEPEYVEGVTEGELNVKDSGSVFDKTAMGGGSSDDDLYNQAVAIVRNDKKTSISYVQRRLRIGYNRAAVLIERMEEEGVLSPADHTGKREIL